MSKHSVFWVKRGGICAILLLVCILQISIASAEGCDYSLTKDIDELPYSTKVDDFSVTASLGSTAELTTNCDWVTFDNTKLEFIDDETQFFDFNLRIPETLSGEYNCSITATVSRDGRSKAANFSLCFEVTNIVKRYDLTVILTDLMTRMPIPNGTIILNTPTSEKGISDEDGVYIFPDVEEGCWDILPSASGYNTERNFVCISRPTTWVIDLLNSSFDFANATEDELMIYEQYLTEKELRMYMNMKQHQPRVIEREKIVYQEVPYSPEAFEKWIEQYNPQSLNDTMNDLALYKGYTQDLREIRSDLANQTKQLQSDVESLKTSRNMRLFFAVMFVILGIIGAIIFLIIRRRRKAGYVSPY